MKFISGMKTTRRRLCSPAGWNERAAADVGGDARGNPWSDYGALITMWSMSASEYSPSVWPERAIPTHGVLLNPVIVSILDDASVVFGSPSSFQVLPSSSE